MCSMTFVASIKMEKKIIIIIFFSLNRPVETQGNWRKRNKYINNEKGFGDRLPGDKKRS